jgi:hypothetical protein
MFVNGPALYLNKKQIPVLTITGEFNYLVVPEENLQAIKESLQTTGNKK